MKLKIRPSPRETSHVSSKDRQWLQTGPGGCRNVPQLAHRWIRSSRAAQPSQNVAVVGSATGTGMPGGKYAGSVTGQHQRARRRRAGPAHDQTVLGPVDLRGRRAPQLPGGLDHETQPVDVALREVPARGVDRQAPVGPVDGTGIDERAAFPARAET